MGFKSVGANEILFFETEFNTKKMATLYQHILQHITSFQLFLSDLSINRPS